MRMAENRIATCGRRATDMHPAQHRREVCIAGHRKRDARGRVDGRVQGGQGGEEATDQDEDSSPHEELVGGPYQCHLSFLAQVLRDSQPGRGSHGPNGHQGDQEVDRHHDQEREKHRPGHVPFWVLHLLARLGDDLVALERDEGEAHGSEHTAPTFREERGKRDLDAALPEHDHQSRGDECQDDQDLPDRHHVSGLAGFRGAPVVDVREEDDGGDGQPLLDCHETEVDLRGAQRVEHELEIGPEAEGVERTGDRVGEPRHPPAQEAVGIGQGGLDPQVPAARVVKRASELRVGHRGEERHERVQSEDEQQRRAGHARRNTGQHEDAGTDHGPDTDHRDVEEAHLAAETDFNSHGQSRVMVEALGAPEHPRQRTELCTSQANKGISQPESHPKTARNPQEID